MEHAEAAYQQCLALYGADNPATLDAQDHLARAYYAAGQHRRAERVFSAVFSVRSRLEGPDDPSTLAAAFGLANALMKEGDWTSARPVLVEVLERSDRVQGADSEMSRRAAINLAITYRELGRYGDELPLRQRILTTTRASAGPSDIDTARSLEDLANVLANLGSYELAYSVNLDALAALEANAASPRAIVLRKWHIAAGLVALKRPDDAAEMFEQVLEGVEQLDPGDPLRRRARSQRRTFSVLSRLSGRCKIVPP